MPTTFATLQQGSSGTIVRDLQQDLTTVKYYTGALDGVFGPSTKDAVIRFQQQHTLNADGIVSYKTKSAIEQEVRVSKRTLINQGEKGREVEILQSILKSAVGNYGITNVDGLFGAATQAAVIKFQKANNLTDDGVIAATSWKELSQLKAYQMSPEQIVLNRIFTADSDIKNLNVRRIGIDVSNRNKASIDWQSVKNSGVSFAFAKATEGITFVDPNFSDNWKKIKAAGLVRGAYHFFLPLKDANEQAQNFLKVLGKLESGDLPPVLDLEHFPERVEEEWKQVELPERIIRVQKWLDIVERATGRKSLIYTSDGFWGTYMKHTKVFTKYPLWVANYGTLQPLVPADNWGGNGCIFWQYTETGIVTGVPGKVDKNEFQGSFEQLLAFVKNSSVA
jgi:lysozyme